MCDVRRCVLSDSWTVVTPNMQKKQILLLHGPLEVQTPFHALNKNVQSGKSPIGPWGYPRAKGTPQNEGQGQPG